MVGVSVFDQMVDDCFGVCCFGLCYGHHRTRRRDAFGQSPVLENDVPGGFQDYARLLMPHNDKQVDDLANEVVAYIEFDLNSTPQADDVPLIFGELNSAGRLAVVAYVINKIEGTGLDPRADFADMTEDEDELDDMEDEDDWDEDDDDDVGGDFDDEDDGDE
jgi:hypothetical protein